MDAFLTSLGLVTLAEMGDKTQLLALFLATRFRRPWPVVGGILGATLVNHTLAGIVGIEVGDMIPQVWLKWGLGLSFLVMGGWSLIPDKLGDEDGRKGGDHGAFLTTLISFFLVEMGDKTQVATMALAAQFKNLFLVASGTTIGMLIADVPAVFLGERLTRAIPAATMRRIAAALFVVLGAAILLGW
ncbi:MAG TPA: TMEM165/GDT1 family protein [Candidatus Sulfotelmatobacter sp.]|jgi:putative Ca2+/H+ antiporter (TMEM165/GDT1 family)|nr:TMEM165/GDT1 family protein [Candidatus Sulfotelmatobacter sp.]